MPNADPNDVLRQTPPEVFAHLEEKVARLESQVGRLEVCPECGGDCTDSDGWHCQTCNATGFVQDSYDERVRHAGLLRKAVRGLRERDVMAEVLVRHELLAAKRPSVLDGVDIASDIRQEVARKAHLWDLPSPPLPERD